MNENTARIDRMTDREAETDRRAAMTATALCALFLAPALAAAAAEPAPQEPSSALVKGLLIALLFLGTTGLLVMAVTVWSRKQDHINEMMAFCMRYLIDFNRVAEGREAAMALGRARDPGALLVLLDVLNDEEAPESLRTAAGNALDEMSVRYRKYKKLIDELKSVSERGDHAKLIRILPRNFERRGQRYVQTAYLIGRAYERQGHYADAKEWFRVAEFRNKKTPLYGDQITRLIAKCNERLFARGDTLFKSANFLEARERYSAASHGLTQEDTRQYSAFLRLACVYCMLRDYEDADQAVLQDLKTGQKTELSLALNKLLQEALGNRDAEPEEERNRVTGEIDRLVTRIMSSLFAEDLSRLHREEPASAN